MGLKTDTKCQSGTDCEIWREARPYQDGSILASSISRIGMLSCTRYTRLQAPHLRFSGFSRCMRGFLHAGQTRISSRSSGIMGSILPRFTTGTQRHRERLGNFVIEKLGN